MESNAAPDDHSAEIERLSAEIQTTWSMQAADELASRLASRGGVRSNAGQFDEAIQDLDRAVGYFERLVEREGQRELAFKLGLSLINRGITFCNQGKAKVGIQDFDKAVDVYTEVVETDGKTEHADMLKMARQNRQVAQQHVQQQAAGGGHSGHPSGSGPAYDPAAVQPMREELTRVGVRELLSAEDVDAALGRKEGTTLLVVNSVCGCAAGGARPGAALALQNKVIPDDITTVFAGMERDAVDKARGYLSQFPASSPFIALFKDGEVAMALQRGDIEGADPVQIAERLADAFDEHCTREGPSIPRAEFGTLETAKVCGSSVPRFQDPSEGES
jgi:putative YphP/YqiW family bacilliredoxin